MAIQDSIARRVVLSASLRPQNSNVTGIILAAGVGRRMGPIASRIPKPLMPVLNCPLVWWNIALLRASGIRNIILNTHHLASYFDELVGIAAGVGVSLRLVNEAQLTGPFGGVVASSGVASSGHDLVVLAGDGIYEVDCEGLLRTHRERDALLTIGVAPARSGRRYGVLDVDEAGIVRGMVEKPLGFGPVASASCGVYVVSPRLLKGSWHARGPLDWIDVVNSLLASGGLVLAFKIGAWSDVGTPEDLHDVNTRMMQPPILSRVAERLNDAAGASTWIQGAPPRLQSVRLEGTVLLGEGARIGPRTTLIDTIVGLRATIGCDSALKGMLVLPNSAVPEGTTLTQQIVG